MIQWIDARYWIGYSLFFSALIVTIRTDLERMLISRFMTWVLLPVGILLSAAELLPLTPYQSILGALLGYSILWLIGSFFYYIKKVEGLGQGDLDLLAMIGAFTGPLCMWTALLIGSCTGSLIRLMMIAYQRKKKIKIPFGPWLSTGAIIYVFFQEIIIRWLMHPVQG